MRVVSLTLVSTKEQILRTAERLFAARGLDGVSLRQIGAAAGNGNNSAVQYHFGSKDRLVEAIFEYRLPPLHRRRRMVMAERMPEDLRDWMECYVVPLLEQGEEEGSHYLSFVAMLQQHARRDLFERMPVECREATEQFKQEVASRMPDIGEPLKSHRIAQAMAFSVHAAADRERAQANGWRVLPFALHVTDLLDGLVGFLEAPVSDAALAARQDQDPGSASWPILV